ncbi:MAG: deoxyguanosinetriphosphate triphosphohydrolase [Hyphomicrobiales bacterium]|nr:deoxyguanosinetriphosphate triphosphohydrolase [Hyphomicrobiales bacterium]
MSPTRTEFQRDRDRIIHSTAFRRLAHKTQVFVPHEGDHYRTRLTHTIEVAQIARALSRAFALDDDLAEALALAHDLGHTPFGHTGEDVLEECMAGFGGFDHNAQALRIVTKLERRYAAYDGLNLAWETLEGLVKHNGPLTDAAGQPIGRYAKRGVPTAIVEYDARQGLDLSTFASAEAQCAAIADDIAYNAHDLDDGLRAGLFGLDEVLDVPFVGDLVREIEAAWPGLERTRVIHELGRRVITRFVEDVIAESRTRLAAENVASAADVRACERAVIAFSDRMVAADAAMKAFLYPHMYRHPRVMKIRREAAEVVRRLFEAFAADPALMPDEWALAAAAVPDGETRRARQLRIVCDYIAGMTDRFALSEHKRLFGTAPELR